LARAAKIDEVVWVDQYFLDPGPASDWSDCDLSSMTDTLVARFRTRAICVNSLVDPVNRNDISRFLALGYELMPKSPVWWFDADQPNWRPSRDIIRDRKLLSQMSDWTRFGDGPFSEHDFEDMAHLQDWAFRRHFSQYHAKYTAQFFRQCHRSGLFLFSGLRDRKERIAGFVMNGRGAHSLSASGMGRDPTAPEAHVVYRLLIALHLEASINLRMPINLGYGASQHKSSRRAVPAMEHIAVYTRHLPPARRFAWQVLIRGAAAAAPMIVPRVGSGLGHNLGSRKSSATAEP